MDTKDVFGLLFMDQPDPRGAGERHLIDCIAPKAKLSICISPLLAYITKNGRFCRVKLNSCSYLSH
jgi:hypothetical protein